MILIDTSVWIAIYRDSSGQSARRLSNFAGRDSVATTDCIMCEVLQGTSSDADWSQTHSALSVLDHLPMTHDTWIEAARIFYELQRRGITVRSTIDCCIAQIALTATATLLHLDRDFDRIATVRPLNHVRFDKV